MLTRLAVGFGLGSPTNIWIHPKKFGSPVPILGLSIKNVIIDIIGGYLIIILIIILIIALILKGTQKDLKAILTFKSNFEP